MIGTRATASVLTTLTLVVFGLGPGAPRPEMAIEARRLVTDRHATADAELATLAAALDEALDVAHDGAAAVLGGTEPPGPAIVAASEALAGAVPLAERAASAVAALESARLAQSPDVVPLPAGVDAAELGSIAIQLAGTAEAADEFAAMRMHAANVPTELDTALASLTDGDLDAAGAALGRARADHAAVAGWDAGFATLPIWVEVADATIGAVERLLKAIRADDTEAADRAAADFADLADEATRADRALQIAMSEGAATVTAAPLSRLARAVGTLREQRAAVGRLYSEIASPH